MQISLRIIGRNILSARKKVRLTQAQAAESLGLSTLHYGRLERGERRPSIDQLAKIASVFGTSIEAFLRGCCPDAKREVFKAAEGQPAGTAEYALLLLDEYREQIKAYYEEIKGNPLR